MLRRELHWRSCELKQYLAADLDVDEQDHCGSVDGFEQVTMELSHLDGVDGNRDLGRQSDC